MNGIAFRAVRHLLDGLESMSIGLEGSAGFGFEVRADIRGCRARHPPIQDREFARTLSGVDAERESSVSARAHTEPCALTPGTRTWTRIEVRCWVASAPSGRPQLESSAETARHGPDFERVENPSSLVTHSELEHGSLAVFRLTWTGEIARDIGPFRKAQKLTAHIAQFINTRGDRIARIETFDCYEPFA